MTRTETPPHRALRDGLVAFVLLWVLGILWAVAGPVYSAPDENAHAAKAIAAVRGDLTGRSEPDARHPVVDLPEGYEYSPGLVCFAYHPERPAACGTELGDPNGADTFSTWVARYNPAYYLAVGWPSLLLGGDAGLYAMRITSSGLVSLLLAGAIALGLSATRSRWMPAAIPFLAAPMVVYMGASVSPQGMEIAAAALLWVASLRLLGSFRQSGEAHIGRAPLWSAVVVAAVVLCVARPLGPLWAVIVVAACLAISAPDAVRRLFSTRSSYVWVAPIAAAALYSVAWTLVGGTFGGQAEAGDAPLVGHGFFDGVWAMMRQTPNYLLQSAGVFGWLDTPLPVAAYVLYFAALAVLLSLAVAGAGRPAALRLGLVIVLSLLVPIVVQASSVGQTGIIWQGRYGMFLYLGVPLVAVFLLSASSYADSIQHLARPIAMIVAAVMAVQSVIAFFVVIHRYVVGAASPVADMLHPEWQPPGGWIALFAIYAATVASMFAWQALLARRSTISWEPLPDVEPTGRSSRA